MPQQINLFHPVLLAPRRHFPAVAMLQSLALWMLGLAAVAGWAHWRTGNLQTEVAATERQQQAERQQLQAALATRETHGDPAVLQQELTALALQLTERRQVLDELGGAGPGASPTPLLQRLSQSLPPPVWLTDIRWSPTQTSLAGQTVQPEALQSWLDTLGAPSGLSVSRTEGETARWSFRFQQSAATVPGAAR
jgi:Tfp pilus assembly protein PilN